MVEMVISVFGRLETLVSVLCRDGGTDMYRGKFTWLKFAQVKENMKVQLDRLGSLVKGMWQRMLLRYLILVTT